MKSTARYSKDDIKKLREVLKAAGIRPTLPQKVNRYSTNHYFKRGVHLVRNQPEEFDSEKQRIQFLKTWVTGYLVNQYGNLAWDVYAFLFHVPFEFVPLYINDETLNSFGLVNWRLDIGK